MFSWLLLAGTIIITSPMNTSHGSPYDRGYQDGLYSKEKAPHYYPNGTYTHPKIDPRSGMTQDQIDEYNIGYEDGKPQ